MRILRWTLMFSLLGCGSESQVGAVLEQKQTQEQKQRDQEAVEAKVREVKEAQRRVDRLTEELDEIEKKLGAAVAQTEKAATEAEKIAAIANRKALHDQKADLSRRLAEEKARYERAKRTQGSTISAECQNNPLGKGCM